MNNITFAQDLRNPNILCILRDGIEIGNAELVAYNSKVVELEAIWIDEEYQNQGYGTQLLEKIISVCRSQGFVVLQLMTLPEYHNAVHLYTKFGFCVRKEIPNCALFLEMKL